MFQVFNSCPLCAAKKFKKSRNGYLNRYSEDISNNLDLAEEELNNKISNVRCKNCDLIYKKIWFKKKYLNYIFNKMIPVHPKGWDKYSRKFTKKYFLEIFKKFKHNNFIDKENFLIREIASIIDSIYSNDSTIFKKILYLRRKAKNLNSINNSEVKFLAKYINKPEKFKRFSGIGNEIVFGEIEKVVGSINRYAEIGCPIWGNFDFIKKNKRQIKSYFIKPDQDIFWGASCSKNGKKCISLLSRDTKSFNSIDICIKKKIKFDFVSVFLCLDHIMDPKSFLSKLKKISNSIGIILEPSNNGVPIQHFTGWNKNSIRYLAKLNNFKIHDSSKLINNINNNFIIFY